MALVDALSSASAKPGLVVSKFDAALNFGADQLAERLNLPLVAVLPARAQALGRAVNQGRLLAQCAERDPYVRALAPLVARLSGGLAEAPRPKEHARRVPMNIAQLLPNFLRRS
jgi:pilus assembly protein CpaE